jgi:hypothetical protein
MKTKQQPTRSEAVFLRLSLEEKAVLKIKSQQQGVSLSHYLRAKILEQL